ncbi:MAG: hypothetical protein ABI718_15815 [Acidobacteriota bacterium]
MGHSATVPTVSSRSIRIGGVLNGTSSGGGEFEKAILATVSVGAALFVVCSGFLLIWWKGFSRSSQPGGDEPAERIRANRSQMIRLSALVVVLALGCLLMVALAYRWK